MINTFITLENLRTFLEHLGMNNAASLEQHRSNYNNPHHVTKEQIGLGNVNNTSDANKPLSDQQKVYIDNQDTMIASNAHLYADSVKDLAIAAAKDDATAKTNAIQNSINTHIDNITDAHDMANRLQALKSSMTSYVDTSVAKVVDGAPEILNTLHELSAAIGNDPNFVTTFSNLLGQKLNSSDVVDTPVANKILRLDATAHFPPSVIAQDMDNRFFTDVERRKLADIAENANNYVHPVTHPASIIVQDSTNRFITDIERDTWNAKQNALTIATNSNDGIMSSTDKLKLNGIETGANKTVISNNLLTTSPGTALDASQGKILQDTKAPINHASVENTYGWGDESNRGHVGIVKSNGLSISNGLISMGLATTSNSGAMSNSDKIKLSTLDTFINDDPKVGFFNDDNVASIFGSFDISKNNGMPVFIISDNRAIEYLYFFANNGSVTNPYLLRRARRVSDSQPWQYSNEEIRPPYLAANERISSLRGIGVEWIIQAIYNSSTDATSWWLIKTFGSGDVKQWVRYKDISSLYDDYPIGTIYFPEYDTLCIISIYGIRIDYKIINVSTFAVVKPKTSLISSLDAVVDYTGWDDHRTSVSQRCPGEASSFYNEDDQQLLIYTGLSYTTGTINGVATGIYRNLFFPFKVSSPMIFKDGIGTMSLMLRPLIDYNHITFGYGLSDGSEDYQCTSYDRYKKRIYTLYLPQGASSPYMFIVSSKNRPKTHRYAYDNTIGPLTTMATPDASPWAKILYSPVYFHDDVIYFRGISTKYGKSRIASQYDLSSLRDNTYINLTSGTWWTEDAEGSSTKGNHKFTAIIRGTNNNRYIYYDMKDTVEILHQTFTGTDKLTKKGKHVESPLANPILTPPTQYNYLSQCYDPTRNRAFFIVTDKVSADPSKQGFPFLLYWDGAKFIEYRNIDIWDNYSITSKSSFGYVRFFVNSNFFIDMDGLVYVICHFLTMGSGTLGKHTCVIDVSKSSPVSYYNTPLIPYTYIDNGRIGYDNNRGYYITGGANEGTGLITQKMLFSKSFNSQDIEKTRDQFFNGDYYTASIDLSPTLGLVAYLQPTPIFIGGYYSMTGSEEIPLEANSDNYIYLERDAIDHNKINVLSSTSLIGGEKGFGRVLVSKITTDSTKIISQINYPISPNVDMSSHVGSFGVSQHALADGINAGFSNNNYTSAEKTKLSNIENNFLSSNTNSEQTMSGGEIRIQSKTTNARFALEFNDMEGAIDIVYYPN